MSYLLPHLTSGWAVDQAIVSEQDRVVVVRFGSDADPDCMLQDEILAKIAEPVRNFAVIYLVDIQEVPDFNAMYELYDPCTTMFFFRNKHIMVDLGTGCVCASRARARRGMQGANVAGALMQQQQQNRLAAYKQTRAYRYNRVHLHGR